MAVVSISGSVWSSIHFDNSCRDGDQEGFLVGEVKYRETTNISDSQINRKTEEVDINVTSHCACRDTFSFYDKSGHIDQVKMLALLRSNYKNVIGFYRFRRNTYLQPSLREMALYHRLLASLPAEPRAETFILAIFSCNSTSNLATHSFPYQLFTCSYNGFTARKVSVVNLGDTAESEYKLSPVHASSTTGGFHHILKNYSTQIQGANAALSGVETVRNLSNDVHSKLQEVKGKVIDMESRLGSLSQEVCELRRRAQRQRQDRAEKQSHTKHSLNTNNNSGLPTLPSSSASDKYLPIAMETNPTSTMSITPTSMSIAYLGETTSERASEKQSQPGPSSVDDSCSALDESMEAKSSDPFAGLLKDMKQSLTKSRSSSMNSTGKESMEGTTPNRINNRTLDSREVEQEGGQESSENTELTNKMNNEEEDDDKTQIQDGQYYNQTLSPTF